MKGQTVEKRLSILEKRLSEQEKRIDYTASTLFTLISALAYRHTTPNNLVIALATKEVADFRRDLINFIKDDALLRVKSQDFL